MSSSYEKGDNLEEEIYRVFSSALIDRIFPFKADCCKIYRKRKYFSETRKRDIIFDIAIEVFVPGSDKETESPSLIYIVESKNYKSHKVPVDDSEEFNEKISGLRLSKIKGLIVSNNAFQSGTIQHAQSTGLGLLRYFGDNKFKWVLQRSASIGYFYPSKDVLESKVALLEASYESKDFDFYCFTGKSYSSSLNSFFHNTIRDSLPKRTCKKIINNSYSESIKIKLFSKRDIECLANQVLCGVGYSKGRVDVDQILEFEKRNKGLIIDYVSTAGTAHYPLGSISFDPTKITIYEGPENLGARRRFTIAHELGHYFLGHSKYLKREIFDLVEMNKFKGAEEAHGPLSVLEWQANYFASCLLIPKENFMSDFFVLAKHGDIRYKGHWYMYLDWQKCNVKDFIWITNILKSRYGVSRAAIEIKMKNLGILKSPKNAGIYRSDFINKQIFKFEL